MDIFPYVVLRIGGGSFENLIPLNIQATTRVGEFYEKKNEYKKTISDLLFADISEQNDQKIQNRLLNLKRDLFNERQIDETTILDIEKYIRPETKNQITDFINCIKLSESYLEDLKYSYDAALPELRDKLKKLALENCIQNGLVLSSHSLYKNIESYLSHAGEYTKSLKKTEVSIIKYLTRTYAKTSPFSSFNNLGLGTMKNGISANNGFINYENREKVVIKSHIRLNNSLFLYIRNCIFSLKDLYRFFLVKLNPTITKQETVYKYLINFNNTESFQKIQINPIVDYFYSIVLEEGQIKFDNFIRRVVTDELLDASEEDIEAYIYKLIEVGFFEFDLGISGLDTNWVNKLLDCLSDIQIELETKSIIVKTLKSLAGMVPVFENADIKSRLEISQKAADVFSEMKTHLDNILKPPDAEKEKTDDAEKEKTDDVPETENEENKIIKNIEYIDYNLKPETIFYEDTTVEGEFCINQSEINAVMEDIHDLHSYFSAFEIKKTEQEIMAGFFKSNFGESRQVDLLEFYEKYISHKKEEKKKKEEREKKLKEEKEKNKENTGGTDNEVSESRNDSTTVDDEKRDIYKETEKRNELQKKFFDNIIALLPKEEISNKCEINLSGDIMKEAAQTAGLENETIDSSMGFFLQFFHESGGEENSGIKAVLNTPFAGYGKMISRFLHLFPGYLTNEIRAWNEKCSGDFLLAENMDSGIMNYNLHPALMPYEISIPGGNYVLNIENRIPISRLLIELTNSGTNLQLRDKETGKQVFVFDLGFQGYLGRSELFKFLEQFSLAKFIFAFALTKKLNDLSKAEEKSFNGNKGKVTIKPRIVYNNKIVINRKTWVIQNTLLPFRNHNESDSDYFIKIHKWRTEFNIPEEVFVFLQSQSKVDDTKTKPKKNLARDDYKPQYICFNNPFLIRLFEKQLDKVMDYLKIEEMMPASNQLLKINQKKYVTEFVVQTYNS